MQNTQHVPGEAEGLDHYFSLSVQERKTIVDVCAQMYQMTREEQEMLLGIARIYVTRKGEEQRKRAPSARPRLRLVA